MHMGAKTKSLQERVKFFNQAFSELEITYRRTVLTAADRSVMIRDPFTGLHREMLMFASNNYLGLANHPHVKQRVMNAIHEFGVGVAGPPLLNGYSKLVEETEARLALFKGSEAAIIFSSGFMANLGMVSALTEQNDIILYDELSHASFLDGLKLAKGKSYPFPHNDLLVLERLMDHYSSTCLGSIFVCVEGVYSMDGDLAPLNDISRICNQKGAVLILDDAHGTGVLGKNGKGTASLFSCEKDITIQMGTFSKVFSTIGGFLASNQELIEYLRYYSRPYMFSASIPPSIAATILGGIEVLEEEPWLQTQLHDRVNYAVERLKPFGFYATPQAAIITLAIPQGMDLRKSALQFHEKGIFLNPIEFPAVPASKQRFRISIMASHTYEDLDKLIESVEEIWNNPHNYDL